MFRNVSVFDRKYKSIKMHVYKLVNDKIEVHTVQLSDSEKVYFHIQGICLHSAVTSLL